MCKILLDYDFPTNELVVSTLLHFQRSLSLIGRETGIIITNWLTPFLFGLFLRWGGKNILKVTFISEINLAIFFYRESTYWGSLWPPWRVAEIPSVRPWTINTGNRKRNLQPFRDSLPSPPLLKKQQADLTFDIDVDGGDVGALRIGSGGAVGGVEEAHVVAHLRVVHVAHLRKGSGGGVRGRAWAKQGTM